ncbi:hypothetical protein HanIR_Chr10g0454871 [Helianthus annuus]|nr:hypothetical protein HanIR_Chr10g0454871 [Helianthus annuus]
MIITIFIRLRIMMTICCVVIFFKLWFQNRNRARLILIRNVISRKVGSFERKSHL